MNNEDYNPDVLTCIANLSNDEVFTPPKLVQDILDMLPADLFTDPTTTFLDPVSKSGVFLREITKRLMKGLEEKIPDKQERINHIFTNQVFGIAITELTSLLSRRTAYCGKKANGTYSLCTAFNDEQGNIRFDRTEHAWKKGKCQYCGASEEVYSREEVLENHAYQFIHCSPEEISTLFTQKNMKFDVIVGNPPYQLSDGGGMGTSAMPIYHKFIQQAKKLNPRFLSMIVPARWFSGGKGLDEFRDEMLNDNRIREIHDFPEAIDCFPGVQIKGGVCYFLWNRDNEGECKVCTYKKGNRISEMSRYLLEENSDTFIRYNEAISILRKVKLKNEKSLMNNISSRNPFGLNSSFSDFTEVKTKAKNIKLYRYGNDGYISEDQIIKNKDLAKKIKVIISKAGSGSDTFPHQILGVPLISEVSSICTETYIILDAFDSEQSAQNLISYVSTKFFRLLVLLIKNTQNAPRGVYKFVPIQNFSEEWTDEKLYKKYDLNKEEIAFIESMIRPMVLEK